MNRCILCLFSILFATACQPKETYSIPDGMQSSIVTEEQLIRVHVVDHNNLSETITNNEKVKDFAKRDFLGPQPYKKVLRVFEKRKDGSTKSIVTSYYENGQIRQYLECLNGRACGLYSEWYSSGKKKAKSRVIAGQGDLGETSPLTWSFEGISEAWNEEGTLLARVSYQKGRLHGLSETFYSSGAKERTSWFENGEREGKDILFDEDGAVLEEITYLHGKREGPALGTHRGGSKAWEEEYSANLLKKASYFSADGSLVSSVKDGIGIRSLFEEGVLSSQQEIKDGVPQGKVTLFEKDGAIEREYFLKDGKKDGPETRYFQGEGKHPRLQVEWKDGIVQGTVKTWYANGTLESQREMRGNAKHGLFMAWYPDGTVMLVEEYENDVLKKGRYHKRGERDPVSQVNEGEGTATLFDEAGTITEKVKYHEGKPLVSN